MPNFILLFSHFSLILSLTTPFSPLRYAWDFSTFGRWKVFLLAIPVIAAMLLVGVLAVLWGIGTGIFKGSRKSIWFSGGGAVLTVLSLLLLAGFNNTAYYPSLSDMQSSLTIYNSSSSLFTLEAMSIVSIFIPFVVAYIWYSWRAMNRKPITRQEIESDDHLY